MIAYVLKAYPRLSNTFVASEIHRLERAGRPMRLFVIQPDVEPWDRASRNPVFDRIRARPEYLPAAASLDDGSLLRWLRRNLPAFAPALRRVGGRRPVGTARALAAALAQEVRAGRGPPPLGGGHYLKELLQATALADEVMRRPELTHLHAHFADVTTTVTWLASTITGVPFSFTGHAKDIYVGSLNPAGLLRRKLLAADFAVTCTEANRRHLLAIAPEAKVHLVYHGLNTDLTGLLDAAPPRAERNGRLRLLAVGRLVRKKGFDVLIDACAELDRRGVPFDAAIVGPDVDHGEELARRISELGLEDRVRLAGSMDQASLCAEYRGADALCQPCRTVGEDRDGIPNVLVEAMACGLPVVTTGISGIPELVEDGVNGLLVPPEDPGALADALERLRDDRGLAARLARSGEATVHERFDGDRLTARLLALFDGHGEDAPSGPASG